MKGVIEVSKLRRTPLWEVHRELGAKMVEFAGYEMPVQYSSIVSEHRAVRESVGLFDVSHMARLKLKGRDALKLMDWLATNRLSRLKPGRAIYSPMCAEDGGIIDDLVIYALKRNEEQELLIVGNAVNREADYQWISSWIERTGWEAELVDLTDEMAQVAVQGPESERVLSEVLGADLSDLYFYQFKWIGDLMVSRTGYTGEDGFEIYGPPERIVGLFRELVREGVTPCGLGARDTLRLEAGLPLYGNELDRSVTPIEAGIAWTVKLDKDFIGKEAMTAREPRWITIGLKGEGRLIARKGYVVIADGREVGVITSGTMSPSLMVPIAMARVEAQLEVSPGRMLNVRIRDKLGEFSVTDLPFVPHRYRRKPRRR